MTSVSVAAAVSVLSVAQIREAVINQTFPSHHEVFQRLHQLVVANQKDTALLEEIAATVGNHLFPPNHKADSQDVGGLLHALAKSPALTEKAIRSLVDGWCDQVLSTLLSTATVHAVKDFGWEFRSLIPMFTPLLRHPACPLAVTGRFIRQMKNIPGFEAEAKDFLWGLATERSTPPVLVLAALKATEKTDWVLYATSFPSYKNAQALYPDIADLPAEMFMNVVISQGIPQEWFAEQHLDRVTGSWVAPGLQTTGTS